MKYLIIIVLFLAYSASLYFSGVYVGKSKARVEFTSNTVDNYISIKDSIKYVPKLIKVEVKPNIDSIFQVAKDYWEHLKPDTVYQSYAYVASLDTTYEDDLLKADINLVSRIPIDPEAYYKLKFDVKKEVVFVPTYTKEERDTWGIGFGAVISSRDSVRINLYGNLSYKILNYKYFELPITIEFQFNDNLSISDKSLRIGGNFKF